MPIAAIQFSAKCGQFLWTFVNFMRRRAIRSVDTRKPTMTVAFRHRHAAAVILFVFLTGQLLRCGDVESNPGPPKKQTTLSSVASATRSNSVSNHEETTPGEPTLSDVVQMLGTLGAKVDKIQTTIDAVVGENQQLKETVTKLEAKVDSLEAKMDDLEGRSRRNNLLFHGIPKASGKETWQESEELVRDVIEKQMGLRDVKIDRAHRLGGGNSAPIIAKFVFFKDREAVMRNKAKLKGSNVFVAEDFTRRVREIRKKLVPFLKKSREENKQASMVHDHIIVDGRRFIYDSVADEIKPATRT